jgi:hypothetical protein
MPCGDNTAQAAARVCRGRHHCDIGGHEATARRGANALFAAGGFAEITVVVALTMVRRCDGLRLRGKGRHCTHSGQRRYGEQKTNYNAA